MAIFSAIGYAGAYAGAYLAGAAGASIATATSVGLVTGGLASSLAINAATSYLQGRNQQSFELPKPQVLATISQGDAQRIGLYGQGLLGGFRAFHEVADNGELYQIILLSDGPLHETIRFWINNRPVSLDGNTVSTGPQAGWAALRAILRNDPGANYNFIPDLFSDIYDETWLENQATVGVQMRTGPIQDLQKTWPRGSQTNIQWEGKGRRVFNYRALSTGYSDNAAEVIGNYLIKPEGFGIGFGKLFNSRDMIDFANICDEAIPLKQGGTEPRYRLWGTYGYAEQPKAVIGRMLAACDARVYQKADGNVGIIGGKYVEPDFTLEAHDIYNFEYSGGVSRRDAKNVVRSFYTDADNSYQDTEAQPWENASALLTEPERAEQFDTVMSPSHSQTRRLMKIHLGRINRKFTLSVVTNIVGIKARFPQGGGHHTIRVQYPDFNDFDEVCEVLGHSLFPVSDDKGNVEWRCRIELAAIDPEWWEWDPLSEEGNRPNIPSYSETTAAIPVLDTLTSSGTGSNVTMTATYIDLSSDRTLRARARKVGTSAILEMTETNNVATLSGLTAGDQYQVQASYVEQFGSNAESSYSQWSPPITV